MDQSEKKWATWCYVPFVNIVTAPLAAVRRGNSHFCRFHARQGLIIFALWFLTIIIGFISETLSLMLWGIVLMLYIAGIFIVRSEQETKIPIIGHLAMIIPEFYIFKLLTGKMPEGLNDQDNLPTNNQNN